MLDELKIIGMRDSECRIYLFLLEAASASVTEISKATGLYRTHIYDVINNMVKKGYIKFTETPNGKRYEACSPSELYNTAIKNFINFRSIIPSLELRYNLRENKKDSDVSISYGSNSCFNNLYRLLEKEKPIIWMGYGPQNINKYDIKKFHEIAIQKSVPITIVNSHENETNPVSIVSNGELSLIIEWKYPYLSITIQNSVISGFFYRTYANLLLA